MLSLKVGPMKVSSVSVKFSAYYVACLKSVETTGHRYTADLGWRALIK